jgi:DUF4097 and DUF4098 domain-containing protein YvlB
MTNCGSCRRIGTILFVMSLLSLLAAQERKEVHYAVGPRAIVSITNNYGPIKVMPSGSDQVGVTTVSHSDAVTFEHEQHGNRIELRAISSRRGTALVDYSVIVPADAFVTVRSCDAAVHVRGLHGDIILEAVTGTVEAADVNNAHLHVKTLSGPITLTDIRDSHVDVRSVNGDVNLHNVSGSSLEVNSGTGRIKYDGDPGSLGEYLLTSHSGDLEISIPATALVEIKARSLKGESDHAQPSVNAVPSATEGNLLVKPRIVSTSRFVLRSFRGAIHVRRP